MCQTGPLKRDIPVTKEHKVLWVYSAHMMNQENGLLATMNFMVVTRSWFNLSAQPLDSGWKPED